MKRLISLLSVPLFAFGLGGCAVSNQHSYKVKEKGNLIIESSKESWGNVLRIHKKDSEAHNVPYILAIDFFSPKDTIGDGKFEEITLKRVPKRHELRRYAHPDSLEKFYKELKEMRTDYEDKH